MPRRLRSPGFAVTLLLAFPLPLAGQLQPPSTGGQVALDLELRMLGHYKRVLMIGAHPDDEDTELLTVLVRGMGGEAAYLSLNRGEGGQNLIGAELGEALGLLRTEELLAARRLDGARQFFTRAYDFGYSKSLQETWTHWPRDTLLDDVVRIVRRFRPQIIVSIFSGTPRDGHGQHQAAGWLAREAFRVAGDSSRFQDLRDREGLAPWTPLKLYRSTRFDTTATTLTLPGGTLDSAVGKTYHQIAMAGRSLHRSQDMGQLQDIAPSRVRLQLLEDRTGAGATGLFAGIDTTLAGMPGSAGVREQVGGLEAGMRGLRAMPAGAGEVRARFAALRAAGPELAEQLARLDSVLARASGVLCDAMGDDERVTPGQVLTVTLACRNLGTSPTRLELSLRSAEIRPLPSAVRLALSPGEYRSTTVPLSIPQDATPSTPYFLRGSRQGDLYAWPDEPALLGLPREPPLLEMVVTYNDGPASVREVTFRRNDQALGEIRRPLTVVPRIDVKLDPTTELWPSDTRAAREFTVTLTHGAKDTTSGRLRLELPAGWPQVKAQPFILTGENEHEVFSFFVPPPSSLGNGTVTVRAAAEETSGRKYDVGVYAVDYSHIRPRFHTESATANIRVAPLRLPRLKSVGYVRGASDEVPEALRSVGVPVVLVDGRQLARADLKRYDVIVIGPRAYETDSALVENNARVLAYVRAGGLLIVQYQQQRFFEGGFAPFRLTVGGPPLPVRGAGSGITPASDRPVSHDRVTDERAMVRILAESPVVLHPNRLGPSDWEGWVQERGLYFARSWDPAYRPVLETHDPDEAPLEGGLLIAKLGKGTYVYTGLSFFRQLPAAVPGAFRLFANLLALRQAPPR